MKRLGQKICVAVALSLAFVAIWHDSAQAAMPAISPLGQIKDGTVSHPTRIDVDAAGTIYLCDGSVNGVARYDKYGQVLPTLKGAYKVRSSGVAVTPDGSRVFVSVAEPDKLTATAVAVINGSTGELLGYLGSGLNEFKRVVEIDLDGAGNIYVGNFDKAKTTTNLVNTAQIDVYDGTTYAKINSFGKPASSLVGAYYRPLAGEFGEIAGLTVDTVNGEVLVSEGWNNDGISRVQVFALDGTFKQLLPETKIAGPVIGAVAPNNLTQINCKPVSLSVDPSGRVYMLSVLTSTVHVFTTNPSVYLGRFTKGTPDPAYDVNGNVYPWTVGMIPTPAFDTLYDPLTGRLFVVTDGNGIQIFSVDGSTNPLKTNRAPETTTLISPVQDSVVATLTPTLQWSAALDADNDVLTYNVQIKALNDASVSEQKNIATTSQTVAAGKLVENNRYSWQVQAADAELTSSYSAAASFWVNAVEEAPAAALLAASPANATRADKDTIFSWQAATDVDPFATVSYRLEIARNGEFTAPVISVKQAGLSSAALSTLPGYDDLQSGTTYNWRVVSIDNTGLATASEVRSFFSNSAPETPVVSGPVQKEEVTTLTPTLQWAAAFDADGDALSYNVLIVDAAGAVVTAKSKIATTGLLVADGLLLENNNYGWQVQAADAELTSSYSIVENFWVNAVEEAPTAPVVDAPAAAVTADKNTIFSWQAAIDADPLATVTYRLEIAKAGDFSAPVISVEQGTALNSAAFSTFPGYADLQPDATYQWRVVAVDNTNLATASEVRSFSYDSTVLSVNASFPGAKVYLGGNGAYSGRYVGEVPVELRDINPGTVEVVVELAGFEPWISNVVVKEWQGVAVNAALVVAILPGDFKKASLLAGGLKIQGGAEAAPVFVDFNSDGVADLLVADGSGKLLFYTGVAGADWSLGLSAQLSGVTLPVGAVPFSADWDNDNRKDLLVGAADGSVSLYLNIGTQEAPAFAAAIQLQADNAPIDVGSNAAPLLFDINDDGAKDLLVGNDKGELYKFLNIGSDAAPLLAVGQVLIVDAAGTNASALVADWDADGSKEILFTANKDIALYERQSDGSYVKGAPLLVHQSLYSTSKARTYDMQSSSFGQKIRLVAANTDGTSGKDLLIGNAAGEILLAYSTMNNGSSISPLFDTALLATLKEIEALMQAQDLLVAYPLTKLTENIQSTGNNKLTSYVKARQNVADLQDALALPSSSELSVLLDKLQVQLNSEIPLK